MVEGVDNLEWLSHLSHLERLDMSEVNLSYVSNWLQVINTLPSLLELHLLDCGPYQFLSLPYHNLTALEVLDLSVNHFNSPLPDWFSGLNNLLSLYLSYNSFQGPIPRALQNLTKLTNLHLSWNEFNSTIPNWLNSFKHLEHLDLSYNAFHGTVSAAIDNLTSVSCDNMAGSVVRLDLKNPIDYDLTEEEENEAYMAQLGGEINPSLLELKHLKSLDLSSNDFNGTSIPRVLGFAQNLSGLYMVEGVDNLEWLSHLSHLEHLDMSQVNLSKASNWLQVISTLPSLLELHLLDCGPYQFLSLPYHNLTALEVLDLSVNHFNSPLPDWFSSLNNLLLLYLSHNSFRGPIPHVLKNLTKLTDLDLSSNKFNSTIPNWFDNLTSVTSLYLRENNLEGEIPNFFRNLCRLIYLGLFDNYFKGDITGILTNLCLCVPSSLEYLSLGRKKLLSGNLSNLHYLSLGGFDFFGRLDMVEGVDNLEWLSHLSHLERLDMSEVNLSYVSNWLQVINTLPSLLELHLLDCGPYQFLSLPYHNLTALEVLDLSVNHFNSPLPDWFSGLNNLLSLYLSYNSFQGPIPRALQNLTKLTNLHLSWNEFNSTIPNWLNSFKHLEHLDLSYNAFHGTVSAAIDNLTSVSCDNMAGSVVRLDLKNPIDYDLTEEEENEAYMAQLGGEINPSLLELKHLKSLDLSSNDFNGTSIPRVLGFAQNLSGLYMVEGVDNLEWLSHLSHLEHLDMSQVNLSKASNWLQVISTLPSLLELHLLDCGPYQFLSLPYHNLTALEVLDLSVNHFNSPLPDWFSSLNNLLLLYLSHNSFRGPIPHVLKNLTKLTDLDLSSNKFNSTIPNWFDNLTSVTSLYLRENNLEGEIPNFFRNLCRLIYLGLFDNYFKGDITGILTNLCLCVPSSLEYLSLGRKKLLSGNLSNLHYLSLGGFDFFGRLDMVEGVDNLEWLSHLSHLERLDMSEVNLSYVSNWLQVINTLPSLLELHLLDCGPYQFLSLPYHNLTALEVLDLSVNHFNSPLPDWFSGLNNLLSLYLSYNSFQGPIPRALQNLTKLTNLHLSWNEFNSTIPNWLNSFKHLEHLDLSYNAFHGTVSAAIDNLTSVSCDNMAGSVVRLDLKNPIDYDLTEEEENEAYMAQLGGEINPSLLELKHLKSLDLSSNDFNGTSIPRVLGFAQNLSGLYMVEGVDNLEWLSHLSHLEHLDMSQVNLSKASNWLQVISTLPSLLELHLLDCGPYQFLSLPYHNLTALEVLDLSVNHFNSPLPDWFSSLNNLLLLYLSHNSFRGPIPHVLKNLTKLTDLDLSSNKFNSTIPNWFDNLTSVTSLYLRENNLEGEIPNFFRNLCRLIYLGLFDNYFKGDITGILTNLCLCVPSSLEYLSLGRKKLLSGNLSNLHYLSLGGFDFFGRLDMVEGVDNLEWLSHLSHLERLDMSEVNLSYVSNWLQVINTLPSLLELHLLDCGPYQFLSLPYHNLTALEVLDLSVNHFNSPLPDWFSGLNNLLSLYLSYNSFQGPIPRALQNLTKLTNLHLSWNEFNSTIPNWLNSFKHLEHLDLSYNAFHGTVSAAIDNLTSVSCDNMAGSVVRLDLKNPIDYDLTEEEENEAYMAQLGGEINPSLLELKHLKSLDLSSNDFNGTSIPRVLGFAQNLSGLYMVEGVDNLEWLSHLSHLEHLDMSQVNLSKASNWLQVISTLPSLLELHLLDCGPYQFLSLPYHNLTALEVLDLSVNHFNSPLPDWFSSLNNLLLLYLSHNSFRGPIPHVLKNLTKLTDLDLSSNKFNSTIPNWFDNLTSVTSLYLRENNLEGEIPNFFRNLCRLIYLGLFDNYFKGDITGILTNLCLCVPSSLEYLSLGRKKLLSGNLSNLHYLSLGGFDFFGRLDMVEGVDNLEWLSHLSHLERLDMSEVNLSYVSNWLQVINTLPSLLELHLLDCGPYQFLSLPYHNLTALEVLDLSVNHFNSPLPDWFSGLNNLLSLYLSYNSFQGPIPRALQNLTKLTNLHLSWNEFNSTIPNWLNSFKHLEHLDLSYNAFHGTVSAAIDNLTSVSCDNMAGSVVRLDLKNPIDYDLTEEEENEAYMAQLGGEINPSLLELKHLKSLDLSSNDFNGTSIPRVLGFAQNLSGLYMVEGVDNLEWLSHLSHLEHLDMSQVNLSKASNWLQVISTLPSLLELHLLDCGPYQFLSLPYHNLTALEVLDLSVNHFNSPLPDWFSSLNNLLLLYLSHNSFRGPIPHVLKNLTKLTDLDLSSNKFNSTIPNWFDNLTSVTSLYLRENNLEGEIPNFFRNLCRLIYLGLFDNYFKGDITGILTNLCLCVPSSLEYLSLGRKKLLSGNLSNLHYLSLGGFDFFGRLDMVEGVDNLEWLSHLSHLERLDMSEVNLSYVSNWLQVINTLPSLLELHLLDCGPYQFLSLPYHNLTALEVLDLSVNHFNSPLPDWFSGLNNLLSLYLSYNSFQGPIPRALQNLTKLTNLHLSWNEFNSTIPNWLNSFKHLEHLDLSYNAFHGTVSAAIDNLTSVSCDNMAGSVVRLDLKNPIDYDLTEEEENEAYMAQLGGEINPSLLELKHLKSLDLSSNDFNGTSIPRVLGFAQNLSGLYMVEGVDNLEWLSHLSHLEHLDMSQVNLSKASNWLQVISTLPSLLELHLLDCGPYQFLSLPYHNLTALEVLDLSVNHFNSPLPDWFSSLNNLLLLYLSHNSFRGPIPHVLKNLTKLTDLDLSSNKFNSTIPNWFDNLTSVTSLYLRENNLEGEIPNFFRNLCRLIYLGLFDNYFKGDITGILTNLCLCVPSSLEYLSLGRKKLLSGNLSNLHYLSLGGFDFFGRLDMVEGVDNLEWLSHLSHLERLDMSEVNLSYVSNWLQVINTLPSLLELHLLDCGPYQFLSLPYHNLTALEVLDLSVNHFNSPLPDWFSGLNNLLSLYLSYNSFQGPIPRALQNLTKLTNLHLSWNEFNSTIPNWLNSFKHLEHLDLSYNAFHGTVSAAIDNLTSVSCDNMAGSVVRLDLKNPIDYDLTEEEENEAYMAQLGGEINPSLLELKHLKSLDLSSNDFNGTSIPRVLGFAQNLSGLYMVEGVDNLEWLSHLSHLEHLDMSQVNLSKASNWLQVISTLPSLLELHLLDCGPYQFLSLPYHNLTALEVLDLSVNHFNSPLPDWFSSLNNLLLLYLSHNSFRGPIPHVLKNLTKLTDLDLSSNKFNSTIPNWFDNLTSVTSLYLRENNLEGEIPNFFRNLCRLIYLGLFDNYFKGDITGILTNLCLCVPSSLEYLSLGRKKLLSGNLSNLHYLSLGGFDFFGRLDMVEGVDNLEWLSHLSHLERLDMSEVNLSYVSNWLQVINTLPSLLELHLLDCGPYQFLSLPYHNLTALEVLDLSVNHFNSPLPDWFSGLNNLLSLYLSYNSFQGPIPRALQNLTKLTNLHLSWNEFNSTIPNWLNSFKHLEHLDLSYNAFHGTVSAAIDNLTSVSCDNMAGSVVRLDLKNPIDYDLTEEEENEAYMAQLGGEINPSLLELKHLKSLDLSSNDFNGTSIPRVLGFAQNLSGLYMVEGVDNLEWLSHLSHLEHLDMSQVNLSKASNWLQVISTLPSLLELHLLDCGPYQFLSLPYHNLTALEVLDLSVNHFNSPLPDWFSSLNNLLLLYLSHNSFRGPIPHVLKNLTKLTDLDLSSNKFNSTIPNWFDNLTSVTSLYLRENNLEGEIPNFFRNLCRLIYLGLFDNYFKGDITGILTNLCLCVPSSLEYLSLGRKKLLSGNLSNLHYLSLGGFDFFGRLDMVEGVDNLEWLSHLSHLERLDMSEVNLSYVSNWLQVINTLPSLLELHLLDCGPYQFLSLPYHNLTALEVLDLSVNHFNSPLPDWFSGLNNLLSLYLSYNSFQGPIPRALQNLTKLTNLHLSWNEFNSTIPNWLNSFKHLEHLDLSYNAFHGTVSAAIDNLTSVSCDNMAGSVVRLDLKNPIDYDLTEEEENEAYMAQLGGEINPSLLELKHLKSLDLSSNDFNGTSIPRVLGFAQNLSGLYMVEGVDNLEWLSHLSHLEHLDMSQVNLSKASNWLQVISTLPSLLELHLLDCGPYQFLSLPYHNLTALEVLDLSVNHFNSPLPDWFSSLNNLLLLYLSHNSFRGPIPHVLKNLTKLTDLDLSSNKFNSTIPNWFDNLTSVTSLYLRENNLEGEIPNFFRNLCRLIYLGLFDNYFKGDITGILTNLCLCVPSSLEYLSLGRKKLLSGNLSNLHYLSLGGFDFFGRLDMVEGVDNLEWLSHLSHLERLDMSEVNLSYVSNWLQVINTLPSLLELHLLDCGPYQFLSLPYHNLTALEVLDLSVNHFNSPLPDWFSGLNNLLSLYLSYNSFQGPIPRALQNLTKLTNLHLSWNEFNSTIPNWLNSFKHLEHLDLSYNAFHGTVSAVIDNLTSVSCDNMAGSVVRLDLKNPIDYDLTEEEENEAYMAQLGGEINPSLLELKHLKSLDLSSNDFNGTSIPRVLGFAQNLSGLYMVEGVDNLEWLSHLSHLEHLDMSQVNLSKASNWLQVISTLPSLLELHLLDCGPYQFLSLPYHNLTALEVLDLSVNHFNSPLPDWFSSLNNLLLLYLSHNSFRGPIPHVLKNLTKLTDLDLSSNKFNSTIPNWFDNLTSVTSLYLRENNLEGEIPNFFRNLCRLIYLGLFDNYFKGDITGILTNLCLCVPSSLEYLSLGRKKLLSGNLSNLHYLSLGGFDFFGRLDMVEGVDNLEWLSHLSHLERLDMSEVNLSYVSNWLQVINTLPSLLELHLLDCGPYQFLSLPYHNLTALEVLDLSVNHFNSPLPDWFSGLNNLLSLYLSYNSFQGPIPRALQNLTKLTNLHLSWNEFNSTIPNWLNSFKHLEHLDLSYNAFHGTVSAVIDNLTSVSCDNMAGSVVRLDLKNPIDYDLTEEEENEAYMAQLGGEINPSLLELKHLKSLDLSSNDFNGTSIPRVLGFAQKFAIS
ncbi:hypothetical protein GIB67_023490 [Kingdonia uniflora]|uniref:Chaoptin n=1 Tax=Kingdonia uniflora TaxID=39325 RepID=A0A7J7P9W3_9MAGN|nr:hypothetical protein GIB67_023490 [Kingdonia uniflora]